MKIEKLGIEHKDLLVPLLKSIKQPLSEYTFPNLYLFRQNHDYEVVLDKEVFVRGRSYDGHAYLMPTTDLHTIDIAYLKEMMRTVEYLFPIPEALSSIFDPDEFDISFAGGEADYVYTVEKMSTLKGRNLHKKRNLLKQFLELYQHDAKPLTNDRLYDARFILKDWLATTEMDPADTDHASCLEALERYDELILCGGIYYAAGEPAGFVLGEELNE